MELQEQLDKLKSSLEANLEQKNTEGIAQAIKSFEEKNNDAIAQMQAKEREVYEGQIKAMQEQVDNLDIKLKEKEAGRSENESKDAIKSLIQDNFDQVKAVRKGNAVMLKAVGDMKLTTSLTGDQPRSYNYDVVSVPSPKVDVADLAGAVQISGGTYTFVKVLKGEGGIGAQTEGQPKSQIDYDYTMVDVNTDFIAGFARYSKKMANNLPFLESSLPVELRRDYAIAENAAFNTILEAQATSSVLTDLNKAEMLLKEVAGLIDADYSPNGIVVRPSDYYDILTIEKSTGAGYGLPIGFTYDASGAQLRCLGIPVVQATWVAQNKYYVGDWSRVKKITTEGLSLEFSETEGTNFVKNEITARIESQCTLVVEQPLALKIGDFTAVSES